MANNSLDPKLDQPNQTNNPDEVIVNYNKNPSTKGFYPIYKQHDGTIIQASGVGKRILARFIDLVLIQSVAFIFFIVANAFSEPMEINQYFSIAPVETSIPDVQMVDVYTFINGGTTYVLSILPHDLEPFMFMPSFVAYYIGTLAAIFFLNILMPSLNEGRSVGKLLCKQKVINIKDASKSNKVVGTVFIREVPMMFMFLLHAILVFAVGYRLFDFYQPYSNQYETIYRLNETIAYADSSTIRQVFSDETTYVAFQGWVAADETLPSTWTVNGQIMTWTQFQELLYSDFKLSSVEFMSGVTINDVEIKFINSESWQNTLIILATAFQTVIIINCFALFFVIGFTKNKQGYHDLMAGSAVVNTKENFTNYEPSLEVMENEIKPIDLMNSKQRAEFEEKQRLQREAQKAYDDNLLKQKVGIIIEPEPKTKTSPKSTGAKSTTSKPKSVTPKVEGAKPKTSSVTKKPTSNASKPKDQTKK